MTDPRPDQKDCFISTFENLLVQEHSFDVTDKQLRDEIRQRIDNGEIPNVDRISEDK